MLIGVGMLMLLAERIGSQNRTIGGVRLDRRARPSASPKLWQSSLAHRAAESRSPLAFFRGLDRYSAGRFSFLLSTPAVGAAAAKAAYDLHKHGGVAPEMQVPFLVGVLASALTGGIVIACSSASFALTAFDSSFTTGSCLGFILVLALGRSTLKQRILANALALLVR